MTNLRRRRILLWAFAFPLIAVSSAFAEPPMQFLGLTGCQLSTDPYSLVTTCTDQPGPNIPIPVRYDGTAATLYTSLFGAKYFRITLPTGITDAAVSQMMPDYAKVPAWNADGTKLMLFSNNGFLHLFDGNTYQYIEELTPAVDMHYSGQDVEPRWDKVNPNIFYYVYGMQFRSYNIATHKSVTLHTFTDAEIGCTGTCINIHNGDEGNSDDQDRYWAFYAILGAPSYAQQTVFVYDKQTNTVISHKGYGVNGLCGASACPLPSSNWVGMSHSGNHVLVNWNTDAGDGNLSIRGTGQDVFDRNLNFLSKSSEKNWHCDVAQLEDGTDVFVGASNLAGPNGYRAVRAVRLNDGAVMTNCMLPQMQFQHISGRTMGSLLKGWILYSTYDQTGFGFGTGVFASENFAINMNTCEVRRIAHTQSYWSNTNYFSEPHSSVNWNFTKIVWGANWRDPNAPIQTYVAELPGSPLIKTIQIK